MQKNMDSFQPNFPMGHMNFPPPGGAPVTPTRRPEAQRLAQPSIIPGGQIYPHHQRMDQMTGMYPMMPYNMMPYYQQGFMDVPYLPDAAIPTVAGKNMKQSKGVDPESAIQVCTPYHAYKFTCFTGIFSSSELKAQWLVVISVCNLFTF